MFSWIAKLYVRSKISKDNGSRKKQFLPWDKIEKIALILDKNDNINKSEMDKFLESTKKFVDVFYIELASKEPSYTDWHCFSKKDKSVLNLPKGTVQAEIKNKKFDIVINTSGDEDLFAYALAADLSAPLKCGVGAGFNAADLIINKTSAGSIIAHLNNVFTYLKMIRV